ncbi:MAG TPA: cobalt-precorrin-5B (C(1))-methyltransferase [Nitrospiraceae bacterium]|nr:cobalt-precorrin-5B (C(1))-methyltransferase [Nitrospiraceae bacterium]
MRRRHLRLGYTTGACAAAAAKAAVMILLNGVNRLISESQNKQSFPIHPFTHSPIHHDIEIPFPDGSRHKFKIQNAGCRMQDKIAWASVIKDAGDDPDVTNRAEIVAEVKLIEQQDNKDKSMSTTGLLRYCSTALEIKGGKGVGVVTKPGLPIPVGEPAINPVPRKMIKEAVTEALKESLELRVMSYELKNKKNSKLRTPNSELQTLEVIISVTDGEKLAKKTLNQRLGIMGGISILGTTGIVKPVSSDAWTATIRSSMDVAKATGQNEIVLSAGRASELAHMKKYNLPEECYVMMGDYLEFSLLEAKKHELKKIHLCAQWAKMLKIAMATPQTHVRHGAIDLKKAVEFLKKLDNVSQLTGHEFNTAREIFDFINSSLVTRHSSLFLKVCTAAKKYAEKISPGIPVNANLVSYEGDIIETSE